MGNANTEMFVFNSRDPSSSTEHVLVCTCIQGTYIHSVLRFKLMFLISNSPEYELFVNIHLVGLKI